MHSSRMLTVRSLLYGGEVVVSIQLCPESGVSVQWGVSVQGLSLSRGLCPEGASVQWGVSVQGSLCPGGSLFTGGGLCPQGVVSVQVVSLTETSPSMETPSRTETETHPLWTDKHL